MSGKFDKVTNALRLGKHYRIERFGISFIVLSLALIMCVSVCLMTSIEKKNVTLATQSLYTTSFSTSRTNVRGSVQGVYRSEDGKGCMVILQFDDIAKVSTNAANYQMFLTSAYLSGNPFDLLYRPSGSIYMFGSSGYMGIYLYSESGFEPQILDLVIRCNAELVSVQASSTVSEDASFDKFDQFRLYFNPGATNAKVVSCLNGNDFTLFDIYEELICRENEKNIRAILQEDLEAMRVSLNAISEYESRLGNISIDGANMIIPERPVGVLGDYIETREDGQLIYHCEVRAPRGVDFAWWDGSIQEGYLDDIIPDGQSYMSWLNTLNKEQGRFNVGSVSWYLSDGSAWADYEGIDDAIGPAKDMNNTISLLLTAYSNYHNIKSKYQQDHLRDLLALEMEARNVETNYTINASDAVLRLY